MAWKLGHVLMNNRRKVHSAKRVVHEMCLGRELENLMSLIYSTTYHDEVHVTSTLPAVF